MTDYVLVPGAWLGAWAWQDVVAELTGAGHGAHPLSLSGLAERSGTPAGQATHVRDIVDEVDRLGSQDVVLVGHSYSGIPVAQAAGRLGSRLRRVVFVDACVPRDGESFASGWWQGQAAFEAVLAAQDGGWAVPAAEEFAGQDLTDEQIARFTSLGTAHPAAALTEPAALPRPLGDLPATYVKCLLDGDAPPDAAAELLKSSDRWDLVEMGTGHWPMFSRPRELARILLDAAGDDTRERAGA
ncbi:alpha/beta fold hydrolase [Streptomyces sp. KL116D]|uniref:alpha/beta fold hydrolase n=1 Tax=Streptomyces sp. KL116D TaxID=3045152 RepID=UPI0035576B00